MRKKWALNQEGGQTIEMGKDKKTGSPLELPTP